MWHKSPTPTLKLPKRREFQWCRLENGFPDLPLWRAVASRARAPVTAVICVVVRLECLANKSIPRGSVADMSVAEFAASLQLRTDVVARIRLALEEPDISWIEQDIIVGFYSRNPDTNDSTAADRTRRYRARQKEARGEELAKAEIGPPTYPQSRHVTRDVTPDQIREFNSAAGFENSSADVRGGMGPPRVEEPQDPVSGAQEWLTLAGLRIVTERLQATQKLAEVRIERWLNQDLEGDAITLRRLIESADRTNYVGARFHNLIVDAIRRERASANGRRLPLGPAVVAPRKSNG